ncbi:MAG: ABC transporter substrate-binding protein [Microvirga sp.]
MRRRDVILLLIAAATSRIPPTIAQTTASVQRIGWVEGYGAADWGRVAEKLQSFGWVRGGNIRADVRVAAISAELPTIAKEVVGARPNLIVTNGTTTTVAILAETRTIPLLFFGIADPIGNRVVDSFARPGGNVTGFASYEPSLAGKWLQLLREVDPRIKRAAMLFNPDTTPSRSTPFVREFEAAATALVIEPIIAFVQNLSDIEKAIATLARDSLGALLVLPDDFTWRYRSQIINFTWRHRVPAIFGNEYAVATGGLMSYGPRESDLLQNLASYIDRILRGANVGELPVQSPTHLELALNLRTARMLGLEIAPTLVARADSVID